MENPSPTLEKVKEWADRILAATKRLATGPNPVDPPTLFPRLVEAAFRRDYTTLFTVRFLSNGDQQQIVAFGNSCMDLSRRVFEDLISLTYMCLGDKNVQAQKFWDYLKAQDKLDLEYLKAAGITPRPEDEELINGNFEKVKKEFLDKSRKTRWNTWKELAEHLISQGQAIDMGKLEEEFDRKYETLEESIKDNWSGTGVESMIVELAKAGKIGGEDEKRSLFRGYVMGNDKNHMSPRDLITFLDSKEFDKKGAEDMRLALLLITMDITKLAQLFISEFEVSEEIVKEVEALWQELLTAHLPKETSNPESLTEEK